MHGPKSRPSSADLPMPDLLKDRLLISIANHWWAKGSRAALLQQIGQAEGEKQGRAETPRNTKGLGDRRVPRFAPFDTCSAPRNLPGARHPFRFAQRVARYVHASGEDGFHAAGRCG